MRRFNACILLVALALLSSCAPVSWQDKPALLTGHWGWNKQQCRENPMMLSFNEDGSTMSMVMERGLFLGNPYRPQKRIEYRLISEGPRHLRFLIIGEDRLDVMGNPVQWDLMIQTRNAFCWHRSDWPADGCTERVRRCRE